MEEMHRARHCGKRHRASCLSMLLSLHLHVFTNTEAPFSAFSVVFGGKVGPNNLGCCHHWKLEVIKSFLIRKQIFCHRLKCFVRPSPWPESLITVSLAAALETNLSLWFLPTHLRMRAFNRCPFSTSCITWIQQ